MVRIELQDAEAAELRDILTNYVSDLRMEVSNTENLEWREDLKRRESFLKGLMARLEPVPSSSEAI